MYFLLLDYRNTGKRVGINFLTLSGLTSDDSTYYVTPEPGIKDDLEEINATLFLHSQNYVRNFQILPEDFKGSKHDLIPHLYKHVKDSSLLSNPFVICVDSSYERLMDNRREILVPYENPYDTSPVKTIIRLDPV